MEGLSLRDRILISEAQIELDIRYQAGGVARTRSRKYTDKKEISPGNVSDLVPA